MCELPRRPHGRGQARIGDHGIHANQASQHVELEDAKNNYSPKRDPVLLRRTAGGVFVPVQPVAIAGVSANKKSGLFKKGGV